MIPIIQKLHICDNIIGHIACDTYMFIYTQVEIKTPRLILKHTRTLKIW